MAHRLITEMEEFKKLKLSTIGHRNLASAISYFKNNHRGKRMNYAEHVVKNHSIGSGVTESACKVVVKQRLCESGMRWKNKGASVVLSLRTLVYLGGHWKQFWHKINQYGISSMA